VTANPWPTRPAGTVQRRAPPTLLHEASRLVTRQRLVNLVVTNVPGPQFPLYLDGRELTDIFPMVPLGSNLGLGIAIVSYNGTLNFGLVGDFAVMHDLEDLADDVLAALQELTATAAGPHVRSPPLRGPGMTSRRCPSSPSASITPVQTSPPRSGHTSSSTSTAGASSTPPSRRRRVADTTDGVGRVKGQRPTMNPTSEQRMAMTSWQPSRGSATPANPHINNHRARG
jgi:diacylglycerol O-acyltransferase